MTRLAFLRDALVVAEHELLDSLRSRRVVILALLYVGGAVAGTFAFVSLLESLEANLVGALGVAAPDKPGAVTEIMMHSEEFVRILDGLIRDEELARELASLPPLALFYGWLALTFAPPLVMLTASESISSELSSGSIRFSLVRTDRLSFSTGKLMGQALLMGASVAAGALGVWVTGYFALDFFDPGATAWWLLWLSLRASAYGFAYVGLALGLSHLTRSVPVSRALGLLALIGVGILYFVCERDWVQDRFGVVADVVRMCLPRSQQLDLWRPALFDHLRAMVMLGALGIVYFALGFRFREKRDA